MSCGFLGQTAFASDRIGAFSDKAPVPNAADNAEVPLGPTVARAHYNGGNGNDLTLDIFSTTRQWDGGNVAHYAPDHPRVLIDGNPDRTPWIDLADLRTKGALVVWTTGDLSVVPPGLRSVAADAAVQPPFLLHDRRGDSSLNVGWAILHPRPSYAADPLTPPI